MKQILEKLRDVEKDISREKGSISLFAFLLPEDAPNRWDVLVAAPWITKENKYEDVLEYIVKKIQKRLNKQEIIYISKVLPIEGNNAELKTLSGLYGDVTEIQNQIFLGVPIEHGYFIKLETAKPKKELVAA